MSERVRLVFRSVSEIVGGGDVGLLVLTDSDERRQVAMPCDRLLLRGFEARMGKYPLLDKLLPEVLWKVIRWQSELRFEVQIDTLGEGKYQAVLSNVDTLDGIPISAPEGVFLSFVSRGDVPVMMDRRLFMRQSTVYENDSEGISLPINTIGDDMLRSALDRAVRNENYEMASHLRDEINRRRRLGREKSEDNVSVEGVGDPS